MSTPLVFLDIAGPNPARLITFYRNVFGWAIDADGSFEMPTTSPLPATIRTDPAEKRCYFGVDDVASKLSLIEAEGRHRRLVSLRSRRRCDTGTVP